MGNLGREVVVCSGSPSRLMAGAGLNQRVPARSLTWDRSTRPQVCFQETPRATGGCDHTGPMPPLPLVGCSGRNKAQEQLSLDTPLHQGVKPTPENRVSPRGLLHLQSHTWSQHHSCQEELHGGRGRGQAKDAEVSSPPTGLGNFKGKGDSWGRGATS